ncbi:hypothetical protein [Legionella sp. PC997]|uniref:hypothetical protein n=1 Tax=Legionella sp. PC997 TaxID=2755562 RepID=UPI0015F7A7A7|nr:hypothetical protein [Legionella sp. PC997]QMT60487.1 hypothetical protein HBNCFIEN_01859 [Legionella sp. PC997]
MTKHILTGLYILLGCTFISFSINAEDTSSNPAGASSTSNDSSSASSNNQVDITKDSWLKSVTPLLPDLICKGFENDPQLKKRLDEIKMTYDQCAAKIPDSVSKCQQELYGSIPEKINSDNAGIWGKALGECIGKDFAIKFLIPKSQ